MDITILQDYKDEMAIIEKCRLSGMFINENSLLSSMANTYSFIQHNYKLVREYFLILGDTLQADDGFYYFYKSEYESENVEKAFVTNLIDYIDILKFFTTIDSSFTAKNDYVFNIGSLEIKLNDDIELKNMSEKMFFIKKKSTTREFLESLLSKMKNDGYLEVFNSKEGKYKLMKSFKYIEDTINGVAEYE